MELLQMPQVTIHVKAEKAHLLYVQRANIHPIPVLKSIKHLSLSSSSQLIIIIKEKLLNTQ
jgi:hypothetical protein